jgi:hypothetical protein
MEQNNPNQGTLLDPQVIIIGQVITERKRQDMQWGGPEHDDTHSLFDWDDYIEHQLNKILFIEHNQTEDVNLPEYEKRRNTIARDALIKVAALAVAAVESIDRKAAKTAQSNESQTKGE